MLPVLLAALSGEEDRRAFCRLYEQYGNAMLRVAHRYFPGNQHAAEDAVQNAWLKVVQNFSKIQAFPGKKRGAYLVIIVKNESISLLRKRRQELPFDEALAGEEVKEDGAASVIEVIHKMPETYRAVLELRFVEECTSREIAQKLGLTEPTVNTRIHRGRALLMKKLREEGYAV